MLDLSRTVMRLAQGQDTARMTLARPSGGAQASAEEASAEPEDSQQLEVDPRAVADRVYELMRQDLRMSLERRA